MAALYGTHDDSVWLDDIVYSGDRTEERCGGAI